MKKNKFKYFYIYLIFLVVVPLISIYSINLRTRPKRDEKFSMLLAVPSFNNQKLLDKVKNYQNKDLLDVNFDYLYSSDSNFLTYYSTLRDSEDIVVLPYSSFKDNELQFVSYFSKIDASYIEKEIEIKDLNYYSYQDNIYGIKVYDLKIDFGYSKDIIDYKVTGYEDDYYLFFIKESEIIGLLNDSKNDYAYSILKGFFH